MEKWQSLCNKALNEMLDPSPLNKVVACADFVPIIPPPFSTLIPFTIMSQHRSLKTSGSVGSKRSVLKRGERIKLMKARGQWTEGRLPTNLPKTKSE